MYKKILVALDNSPVDQSLLPHIAELAKIHHSHILLMHVAEGWVALHYNDLLLKESEEMIKDRKYLEKAAKELRDQGLEVSTWLCLGRAFTRNFKHCRTQELRSDSYDIPWPSSFGRPVFRQCHRGGSPLLLHSYSCGRSKRKIK